MNDHMKNQRRRSYIRIAEQQMRAGRRRRTWSSRIMDGSLAVAIPLLFVLAVVVPVVLTVAVPPHEAKNVDPRIGPVEVRFGITKYCDGQTLVYESIVRGGKSISTIPRSDECS